MSNSYKNLCSSIKNDLSQASVKSEEALRYQKVLSNWNIGQSIEEFVKSSVTTRGERTKIVDQLIVDLQLQKRFIQDACKFYRVYLKPPKEKRISWTHYQQLIAIDDQANRRYWEKRIVKEKLGVQTLERLLYQEKKDRRLAVVVKNDLLQFSRGEPYVYRILKVNYVQERPSQLVIDCGFYIDINQQVDDRLALEAGCLIKSIKTDTGYKIARTRNDYRGNLYTYQAAVKRVVDGDTLDAHIDVGFGIRISNKLRLRGIDTPELGTPRGALAKEFVENKLKDASIVVIKSYGFDLHGRTVADVFYETSTADVFQIAGEGKYLNQELLDAGMANFVRY